MALDATQVRIAVTGQLYKAPLGTPLPTDSTTPLDSEFVGLGYVSEDGVVENWDDSVETVTAWQNATTVRSATTESTGTLELTLIQTNAAVLEAFYRGSQVESSGDGEYRLEVEPIVADPSVWVLDVIDGARHIRTVVGNGEITERGEITYANGEPIGFPITISLYPDEDGNLAVKHSDDVAWEPEGS